MSDKGQVVLRTEAMGIAFGGLRALDNVDIDLHEGEILCVIGPNGSGKTTFFNCLSGVYTPGSGRVRLRPRDGGELEDITDVPMFQRARRGIARTFQTLRLFDGMSVLENVLCGFYESQQAHPALALFGSKKIRREETEVRQKAEALLDSLTGDLLRQKDLPAASLPYADRRRLEIARALATGPRVLLLDEPAAGMSQTEAHALAEDIFHIRDKGISLIVIEHNMSFIKHLGGRIVVLSGGQILAQGDYDTVSQDPGVISAYLGEPADA